MPTTRRTARAASSSARSGAARPWRTYDANVATTRAAPSLLTGELSPIQSEIEKRHDESIARFQNWVRNPSIAAEDRGMDEGCDLMIRMARDAGFQTARRIDTDGHPGVFATLDAGAPKTFGLYFMYDVKQAEPAEWSSPPFEAAIVDKPGFGKVLMGRGAVNQKGPEAAFLAALHAIKGAGKKVPVNIVLVAEGEEETRLSEDTAKKLMKVKRWAHDLGWRESLERFLFTPTVNIEGLVAGYTGPGGKTIQPHRAVAKLDLRLVPDMKFDTALAQLKAHLAKRGFGDIEVVPSGGYDPTDTPFEAELIQAQISMLRRAGIEPAVMPRIAGSYPGYVFTGDPLRLPAGHFGMGHGNGAHAPDEYFVIESENPRVADWDGAVASHVAYLFALAG